LSVEQIV